MKKAVFFGVLFILFLHPVFAGLNFQGLDLSSDNRLLFQANYNEKNSKGKNQSQIYISRLTDLALQQVTAFPEKIELLENKRSLLVHNVFGAALIPMSGGLPRPLRGFPFFTSTPSGGRAESLAVSSDGNWLLYVEPLSPAYGDLILLDVSTGNKKVVSRSIERPAQNFPACWSPDSRVFVYCKEGKIYYYPVLVEASVDERNRKVGDGKISSVYWGKRGEFFYIQGRVMYHVRGPELFTRAVYGDFLEIGQALGNLPMDFDPDFDSFWVSPDSASILLLKGGRNLFYYPLDSVSSKYSLEKDSVDDLILPFLKFPSGAFGVKALWPERGPLTVTASVQRKNGLSTLAWRLVLDGPKQVSFASLESPIGPASALSPDGTKVIIWGDRGMETRNYASWKQLEPYLTGPVYSCVWVNNSEYIYADNWWIESVSPGKRRLICLAGASEYGFEEGERGLSSRILAKSGGSWFVTDGLNTWVQIADPRKRKASQISGRYRVYLERQAGFPYENIPMIRNTSSVGTSALLPQPLFRQDKQTKPVSDNAPDGIFNHGFRTGPREVALCFDLYNDEAGLSYVLEALNRFGVKSTFFLNGEFIRRCPEAAASIAESGHEAASMFYAPIDFSDSRYQIDADFVARGLARNEDEYYKATGSELGLMWHPPFFRASAEIAQAASRVGYLTIGRDIDPLDWMSREEALRLGIKQSIPETIERIMEEKGSGSIIPIRLGLKPGLGNEYLFLYIDLLLDSLVRSGFSVVPVSTLVQHGL